STRLSHIPVCRTMGEARENPWTGLSGPFPIPAIIAPFKNPPMNDSPPPSLSTPSWRRAALPAAGGGLVLWLFMSRLAHAATPSANWWFGLGLALLMAGVGCVLRRSASGGRFWGGLVAPVLAGAALGFGAPNSITMGLAVLACVGGAAAVLDWAQEGPRSQVAGSVDALAAGATLLAGLVPAAAAPVIGAI